MIVDKRLVWDLFVLKLANKILENVLEEHPELIDKALKDLFEEAK